MPRKLPLRLSRFSSEQTILCTALAPAMQRITDAINGGYLFAVQGQIPIQKAVPVIEKFQQRYPGLSRDRKYAYRQHKAGKARQKLVCFANRSESQLLFVLFTDLPDDHERWASVTKRDSRVRLYEYEAVRATKPGAGEVWTWQITPEDFEQGVEFMRTAIRRKQLPDLYHMIERTRTWPGFHRVRAQRQHLRKVITAEWLRTMPASNAPPPWPRLRYVSRLRTR